MKILMAVVILLAALSAGCATRSDSVSGMSQRTRRVAPARSTPRRVSVGGESRTRANYWQSR